jgi:hypothetical protein
MNIQDKESKDINEKLTEIKQLIDFSSIEIIIITLSFATLIAGITTFQNTAPEDYMWKIAGLFLIMYTMIPVLLFFSNFLNNDQRSRV